MSSRWMVVPVVSAGLFFVANTAPVTTKYKIEIKAESVVDLSAMGAGEQRGNQGVTAFVAVTLSDTTGGKIMHVVIDSVKMDGGPMPVAPAMLDSAKGAALHGFVDPRGKVSGLKNMKSALDSNMALAQVKGLMSTFYPRMKPGAKSGDSWTDTTDVETKNPSQTMKTRLVTNYVAGAQETVAGTPAMKIEAAFSSTLSGTIENPMAGSMEMEGSETGNGSHYLGTDGRYLGGTSTANGKSLIKAAMAPDPIPVKTTRSMTVTVLP